ncbi:MAG: hypothetical protein Q9P01_07775 [Anaerolineae bacterium]|nr:hypothetical protein [Anaerolineae bacterium]MDQ7034724.1 hypothetical protein [Anaerolineae bacterium]
MATIPLYKPVSQQKELRRVLSFTAQDLAMNQMGRLSERQKSIIRWQEQQRWMQPLMISVVLGLLVTTLTSYFVLTVMIQDMESAAKWPAVLSIILGLLLLWSLAETIINFHDLDQKLHSDVNAVQGIVTVDMQGLGHVGTETFNLSYEAMLRINPLEPHIVYYLPKWNQVLSIEVLRY